MKSKYLWLLISMYLTIFISSCSQLGVVLSPPDWVQGRWQSEADAALGDYIVWEFRTDNALYEYHDPANGILVTFNLQDDFADKWVRDEKSEGEEWKSYMIRIDRTEHDFNLEYDGETETFDGSTLNYSIWMFIEGRDWVLLKQ